MGVWTWMWLFSRSPGSRTKFKKKVRKFEKLKIGRLIVPPCLSQREFFKFAAASLPFLLDVESKGVLPCISPLAKRNQKTKIEKRKAKIRSRLINSLTKSKVEKRKSKIEKRKSNFFSETPNQSISFARRKNGYVIYRNFFWLISCLAQT